MKESWSIDPNKLEEIKKQQNKLADGLRLRELSKEQIEKYIKRLEIKAMEKRLSPQEDAALTELRVILEEKKNISDKEYQK